MTENPYMTMPEDVLKQHFEQLKEVIGTKKLDVSQYFGASISEDDKKKLSEFDSLTSKVNELSAAAAAKDIAPDTLALAEATLNRVVADIKKIDPSAPLASVLTSKFNNLDKLAILDGTQQIVSHYAGQIQTLRDEFGAKQGSGVQTFSKPADVGTASSIIEEMTKDIK